MPDPHRALPLISVQRRLGRLTLCVNDRPLAFTAYSPTMRRELYFEQTARFLDSGAEVFFINVPRAATPESDYAASPFWVGDEIAEEPLLEVVTPTLEEQAEFILSRRPEAWLFVRFGCNEPASWRRLHPDDLFVTETGQTLPCPSLASRRYADAAAAAVTATVRFCERQPWAGRVVGYWTGMRLEGTHEPLMRGWLFDHGSAMRSRWREYLTDRYADDAAIRLAWDDPGVTRAQAPMPHDHLRGPLPRVAADLFWCVGPQHAPLHDYLRLGRLLLAEQVRALADAHRTASRRRPLFVLDTLKQPMQGWDNLSFFETGRSWPIHFHDMLAGSGSLDAAPLLEIEGVDGIITPHDYAARGVGGVCEPEGPADSLVLRGKPLYCELDVRTWTGVEGPLYGRAANAREFEALAWRNLASALTRGYLGYFMDVFTDSFADPAMHRVIRRVFDTQRDALEWPHEDVPGIALVIDDTASLDTHGSGAYANEAILWELRGGLSRCGVPFRVYLLDDLSLPHLPPHRVWYFPNLFRVDDRRLELLRRTVMRDGRVVLWGPGSGISDGRTIDHAHAQRLTGFGFDRIDENQPRRTLITRHDHPVTAELPGGAILGGPLAYGPVLFPIDGDSLGTAWTKRGAVRSGLSVQTLRRDGQTWHSVFSTTVNHPPALWRGLARFAGAHVYTTSGDVLLADAHLVALHTVRTGPVTISLPRVSRVVEVASGKTLAHATDTVILAPDAAPCTSLLRLLPPI